MKIAILGAGSLGSLLAGFLSQDSQIELLVHSKGDHGAMMVAKGLEIQGEASIQVDSTDALFTLDEVGIPEQLDGSMDVVLLTGKAHSTPLLAKLANRLLRPAGIAMSLSNGLGHAEVLVAALGPHRVVCGTTTYAAWRPGPGVVHFAGHGQIVLGQLQGGPSALEVQPLIDAFTRSALSISWSEHGPSTVWMKVLLNIAINAIAALSGLKNGELLNPALFNAALETMLEGARVARQEGAILPDDLELEQQLQAVLHATSENNCSMLQDVRTGRMTEIAYLNQAVVERGERIGMRAPMNQMLSAMIEALTPHSNRH